MRPARKASNVLLSAGLEPYKIVDIYSVFDCLKIWLKIENESQLIDYFFEFLEFDFFAGLFVQRHVSIA